MPDLKALNASAEERIAPLTSILKTLERARFGRRSEKLGATSLDDEQAAFVFDEIQTGLGAIQAELDKRQDPAKPNAPRDLARALRRISSGSRSSSSRMSYPENVGKQKILIGEDVSERLDVVAAKFRVIVTRRPKYAFKNEDGVIQAPAPAHIIEGGIPTEALLAQIAVSKYADGLLLYRQEAIYARDKVDLDRALMAQWMGRLGFELEILSEHVLTLIKTSNLDRPIEICVDIR